MWSYFVDLIIRKIMAQSKLNMDTRFNSYSFFYSEFACMWMTSPLLSTSVCMHKFSRQYRDKQSVHALLLDGPI